MAGERNSEGRRGALSKAPTIRQVADLAGVSRATVSRAFSQPHLLSNDTVAKVHAVAQRLGYAPNQVARALSTGRAGNVALIVPDITNPFFSALIRGAQARARSRGYAMFLGDSDETPELEDLVLTKLAPQVEGFVLVSSRLPDERILEHAARRPLILVNRDVARIPRLLIDTGSSYAEAVEKLATLGHRSIAYVAGPPASWSNRQRERAVMKAAKALGLKVSRISAAKPTYEDGMACTDEVLRTGATAALAFDDVTAHGIMAGLANRGLSVPADFSLVGCDGVLAAMMYPPLTSVTIKCGEVGEKAIDLLLDLLGDSPPSAKSILLPTELIVRASIAPPSDTHMVAEARTKRRDDRAGNRGRAKPDTQTREQ
jgi:LacI family transcriptional regulator